MFPLMLYRDGVTLDDYKTVESDAEEAAASEAGYLRLDMDAVKGLKPVDVEPAKPVEQPKRGPGRPRKAAA